MLRLLGAAAAMALAATNPAFAQGKGDDDDGGKRRGKVDHAAMGHGNGQSNDDDDRDERRGNGKARAERDDGDRGDNRRLIREIRDVRAVRDAEDRLRFREDNSDLHRRGDDDGDDGRRRAWDDRDRNFASVPACPPGVAKKNNGCLPPGLARRVRDDDFGFAYRPALFGIPLRSGDDYAYYDGYLIPEARARGSYVPLLGGALAVGQLWPEAYPSLPLADWQSSYYGFEDERDYRYADNVVYRVDPTTAAIEAVAALLTGSDFNVGERVPDGYDVYNVPASLQERYADSDEAMYRYADGRVYRVDPTSMLIAEAIDLVL